VVIFLRVDGGADVYLKLAGGPWSGALPGRARPVGTPVRDNGSVTSPDSAGDSAGAVAEPDESPTSPRPRRLVLFAIVAGVALALDVVSKVVVVAELPEPKQKRLLGGALYLNQARNSGAAFSLGTGFTIGLTVIALGVVVFILRQAARMRSIGWAVALGLILGGALGNLADRVFRAPSVLKGHVVDWISVFGPYDSKWPIFNLADSAVVCGAILAGLLAVRGIDLDGTRHHQREYDEHHA
jgi:signal peptidase II